MNKNWPELVLEDWQDTLATLHMWTQIVGKIRMKLTPLVNHWWNVPLYVSARGMTTSPIPYGDRIFEIEFDFIDHKLRIECNDGALTALDLRPQTVADFYKELMGALHDLGIDVKIWTTPVEVPSPFSAVREAIPFEQRITHPGSHGFPDATFDYLFGKNVRIGKPLITQTSVSDHLPVTCDVVIQ